MIAPTAAGIFWEFGLKLEASGFVFGVCAFTSMLGVFFALAIGPKKWAGAGEYHELDNENE